MWNVIDRNNKVWGSGESESDAFDDALKHLVEVGEIDSQYARFEFSRIRYNFALVKPGTKWNTTHTKAECPMKTMVVSTTNTQPLPPRWSMRYALLRLTQNAARFLNSFFEKISQKFFQAQQ